MVFASLTPNVFAADLNYSEDVTVSVAGVDLVILANSTASRLVVGTANLIVDVPAGEKFFLISRDGTAMPNTVLIGNEAQAAAAQSCSLNAQGQATSNVLPLFGATTGTKTVTITPVSGTKCTAPGGGASSGGGGGGAVSVSGGTTSTTSTAATPSTPNFVDSGTTAGTAGQTTAPSTSGTTTAPAAAPSATASTPVAAATFATPTEIKQQTASVAEKALDVVRKALEKAAATAPVVAPAQSSIAGSAQAAAPAQQQASAAPVLVVQVSSTASTIAAKFVPTDATPTERAIMQVIVDNPPPAALKKGMGEWGGALNSTRIANNGDIPTEPEKLKAFVANAGLVLNGRFPLPEFKNPDLEQKMITLLEILYKRKMAPSEEGKGLHDRNAIIVAAYGLRQVERTMKSETSCEKPVTDSFVRTGRVVKNSGEYWNLVNACSYSGATR